MLACSPRTGSGPSTDLTSTPQTAGTPAESRSPVFSPTPEVPREERVEAVKSVLATAAEEFPGRIAVGFYDLELGQGAFHNPDQQLEAASLIKLPILVEFYRQAQTGGLDPAETMVFEERFRVGGSGSLQHEEAGTSWPLQELATLMVTQSDNVATDMLVERLGRDAITHQMELLGLKNTTLERGIYDFAAIDQGRDNLTTAADMTALLRLIAEGELPGSDAMHEMLDAQERKDMIPAQLPKGTRVAHKTGELLGVLHDAGIVYTPKGAYVLVFLSQDFPSTEETREFWAELSRKVYDAYTGVSPTPQERSGP